MKGASAAGRGVVATVVAGLLSACGGQAAPATTPSVALSADETASRFTSWLADNTYPYVSVVSVYCSKTGQSSEESLPYAAACMLTAELAPNTTFPQGNPLGLTGPSPDPTYLHDMKCELKFSDSLEIESVLCPTVIGWIFSSRKRSTAS